MKKKVFIRERVVFNGYEGWTHRGITYRLAVGGAIAEAPNGELLCAFMTGSDGEPAGDNAGVISRSADGGESWGEPALVAPSGAEAGSVLLSSHVTKRGELIASLVSFPPKEGYTKQLYTRVLSSDAGRSWHSPVSMNCELGGDTCMGYFGNSIKLGDGRLLTCTTFFRRRPRALRGPTMALARAESEAAALRIEGPDDEHVSRFFRTHLYGVGVCEVSDDFSSGRVLAMIGDRPLGLLEPTMIELKDGTIAILMRAECGGCLWRADSTDGGYHFGKPYPTDIKNPTVLASVARMPDGRIMLVHNDTGEIGRAGKRDPLSVWISDDEMRSFSIREDIMSGGQFAYPSLIRLKDDRMVFGFDYNRRMVKMIDVRVL